MARWHYGKSAKTRWFFNGLLETEESFIVRLACFRRLCSTRQCRPLIGSTSFGLLASRYFAPRLGESGRARGPACQTFRLALPHPPEYAGFLALPLSPMTGRVAVWPLDAGLAPRGSNRVAPTAWLQPRGSNRVAPTEWLQPRGSNPLARAFSLELERVVADEGMSTDEPSRSNRAAAQLRVAFCASDHPHHQVERWLIVSRGRGVTHARDRPSKLRPRRSCAGCCQRGCAFLSGSRGRRLRCARRCRDTSRAR